MAPFTRKSRRAPPILYVDSSHLVAVRFLSFISNRDISTTLSRRIDTARRRAVMWDTTGYPVDPAAVSLMFLPLCFSQRLSFGSGLSANFDYICQQPVLPSLCAFSSRHNSNIDMYHQHLILGHCLPSPRHSVNCPLLFFLILTLLTLVPSDLPQSRTLPPFSSLPAPLLAFPSSRKSIETYLADIPVGDARCNFVIRYVSRLAKVQDENCVFQNVIGFTMSL